MNQKSLPIFDWNVKFIPVNSKAIVLVVLTRHDLRLVWNFYYTNIYHASTKKINEISQHFECHFLSSCFSKCEGRHSGDHMVVGFTATCLIRAYHHLRCEFESLSWTGILDRTSSDKHLAVFWGRLVVFSVYSGFLYQ